MYFIYKISYPRVAMRFAINPKLKLPIARNPLFSSYLHVIYTDESQFFCNTRDNNINY